MRVLNHRLFSVAASSPTTHSWFDVVSVPQDDRGLQIKAIGSLCAYTHLITRFIPLVRDAEAWGLLHGEELGYPSGCVCLT